MSTKLILVNEKKSEIFISFWQKNYIGTFSQVSICLFTKSFLNKNLSNFVFLPWKIDNQYCHIIECKLDVYNTCQNSKLVCYGIVAI